jgi:hypothetical protein
LTIESLHLFSATRDCIDVLSLAVSFVLMIVGMVGIFVAMRTLKAVKRQADEMLDQANLMKEQTAVGRWPAHQPRRVAMSLEKLCPVHRSPIAMSGSSAGRPALFLSFPTSTTNSGCPILPAFFCGKGGRPRTSIVHIVYLEILSVGIDPNTQNLRESSSLHW